MLSILQNELAILEFIHLVVETMDRHFGNVVSLLTNIIQITSYTLSVLSMSIYVCVRMRIYKIYEFAVRARHHVPSGESAFHARGNGHERLHR